MEVSNNEFFPEFLKDTVHEIETVKNFYREGRDDLKPMKNDACKLKHLYDESKEKIAQQKMVIEKLEQKIKDCSTIETKLEMEKKQVLSTQQMYKQEIEKLSQAKQEISTQIEQIKSETEENAKELKNLHEAVKLAIQFYKSALDLYVQVKEETEDCTIAKIYFTKKKDNDPHVVLQRKDAIDEWGCINKPSITWELLEMCPMVKKFDSLKKRLKETNDIQGFISAVETIFRETTET